MKKKAKLKIISLLLTASMCFTMLPSFSVSAKETTHEQLTDSSQLWTPEQQEAMLNTEGDLPYEELETAVLPEADKPEMISEDVITEKGHVNRLWAQEDDLNTIIFQNRDGKKTMYWFDEPVKYKDKDGKIKDKKNTLEEQGNDYTNSENDINSYFPKKIHKNKGVVLRHNDIEIEIAPLIDGSSGASHQTGHNKNGQPSDTVEYPDVFDNSISLRYTPTFEGFKEDIILEENAGINEFRFKVKTGGLSLVQDEGIYYLADPLTGEKTAQIGNLVVYDSSTAAENLAADSQAKAEDKPVKPELPALTEEEADALYFPTGPAESIYHHRYHVQTVTEDSEYIITIIVDEAYLENEDTVYPVTVDPSFIIRKSFSQDATIYSNYKVNEGYTANMFVGNYSGRYGGTRGVARSLVKFPGLFSNSTFQSLSAGRIYKVQYIPRDTMCESDGVWIDCYRVTQNWSEGTVKCNSSIWSAYGGSLLDDNYVYYNNGTASEGTGTGHWYPFDITEAVKDWKNGYYGGPDNHYGIMLKAYNESNGARTFGTNNHSSLGPNVVVEYDPAVTGVSLASACKEVNIGWSGYVSATVYPTSAPNRTVYWKSSDPNVASVDYYSGLICTKGSGSTVITTTTADGGYTARCTLTVIDPYGVKQIWISKIQDKDDSSKFMNLYITENNSGQIFYQSSDMYNTFGSVYDINQNTKDYLNNGFQAYYNWQYDTSKPRPAEYQGVYYAKQLLQNYLNDNPQIAVGSNEYYGLWIDCIEEYMCITEYSKLVSQFIQTVTIIAGTVYQGVVLAKNIGMLVKQSRFISNASYKSTLNGINAMNVSGPDASLYTNTTPLANLQNTDNYRSGALNHVLKGEINSKGKAVGFHYEGMSDSQGSVIPGTKSSPNNFGVYEAKVQVNGVLKTSNGGKSTFFPATMTPQQIVDATNQAYNTKIHISGNTYIGVAASGMEISMYIDSTGKIISFFPIY